MNPIIKDEAFLVIKELKEAYKKLDVELQPLLAEANQKISKLMDEANAEAHRIGSELQSTVGVKLGAIGEAIWSKVYEVTGFNRDTPLVINDKYEEHGMYLIEPALQPQVPQPQTLVQALPQVTAPAETSADSAKL